MTSRIPTFLWLFLPALLLVADIVAELLVPESIKPAFYSEGGPVEKIQEIIIFCALLFSVALLFRVRGVWLKVWFGIAAACCVFVGGEEISWGQHYFDWITPEYWAQFNDQQETNLHNTSSWLDQKPRLLLELGVLIGGLVIPALLRWKPSRLPLRFASIYPNWYLSFTAALAVFVKTTAMVQGALGDKFFHRSSEVIETFLYYFVLLYLLLMWKRFRPVQE